jgi:hypothetical protein
MEKREKEEREAHLEVSEPDLVVEDREGEDVVDEGLGTAGGFGDGEHLKGRNGKPTQDQHLCSFHCKTPIHLPLQPPDEHSPN